MRRSYRWFVAVVVVVGLIAPVGLAWAHPGGLDKCGGHHNRKTGEYHVHNWTLYYNCYGWPDELVDPLKELRNWLTKPHDAKRLVEVRKGLIEQLRELDRQLCEAASKGDKDPGLRELVTSGELVCPSEDGT